MKVVESISELRRICQLSFEPLADQPRIFWQIRRVSVYLTWVLIHFPVSANGVTLLAIAAGLTAAVLFGLGLLGWAVALLLFSILVDFSDGEVARYRKQRSKEGSYLDRIYHFSVHPAIFAGITVTTFRTEPAMWVLVAGFITVISVVLLTMTRLYARWIPLWDYSNKLMKKLCAEADSAEDIRRRIALARSRPAHLPGSLMTGIHRAKQSNLGRMVSTFATYWEFPYIFVVIIAVTIMQLAVPLFTVSGLRLTPFAVLLVGYAVTYPALVLIFLSYTVCTRSIGNDYDSFLEDLSSLLEKYARK